jgi:hypothetical protein
VHEALGYSAQEVARLEAMREAREAAKAAREVELAQVNGDMQPHVCSRMLTYAHVCSRMLTYAHVCSRMLTLQIQVNEEIKQQAAARAQRDFMSETPTPREARMLTYAHVCSRVLTYAHVCSRMLTYAHVCSRILTYAGVC